MDRHFTHALADRSNIAGISRLKPFDPANDLRPGPNVPQPIEPAPELFRLADLDHAPPIGDSAAFVNHGLQSEVHVKRT
jgi:hypothetical protein